MTQSYSLDLRVRVVAFCGSGPLLPGRGAPFWGQRQLRHQAAAAPETCSDRPPRRGRAVHLDADRFSPYEAFLIQTVEAKPDITMPELAARLLEEHGIVDAPAALSRLLCRHGFTYIKRSDDWAPVAPLAG